MAQPNQFAPGTNHVTITAAGRTPMATVIALPNSVQWMSLQIYILLTPESAGWIALNEGQYVAGSVPQ